MCLDRTTHQRDHSNTPAPQTLFSVSLIYLPSHHLSKHIYALIIKGHKLPLFKSISLYSSFFKSIDILLYLAILLIFYIVFKELHGGDWLEEFKFLFFSKVPLSWTTVFLHPYMLVTAPRVRCMLRKKKKKRKKGTILHAWDLQSISCFSVLLAFITFSLSHYHSPTFCDRSTSQNQNQ